VSFTPGAESAIYDYLDAIVIGSGGDATVTTTVVIIRTKTKRCAVSLPLFQLGTVLASPLWGQIGGHVSLKGGQSPGKILSVIYTVYSYVQLLA